MWGDSFEILAENGGSWRDTKGLSADFVLNGKYLSLLKI